MLTNGLLCVQHREFCFGVQSAYTWSPSSWNYSIPWHLQISPCSFQRWMWLIVKFYVANPKSDLKLFSRKPRNWRSHMGCSLLALSYAGFHNMGAVRQWELTGAQPWELEARELEAWSSGWVTGQEVRSAASIACFDTGNAIWGKSLQLVDLFFWITLLYSIVKAMVSPVVMYGCESWIIKKAERWRIDAFELWCWRRLLRVPWTAKKIKPVNPKGNQSWIFIGKTDAEAQYFGHLMW